jgi:hypothetical protein
VGAATIAVVGVASGREVDLAEANTRKLGQYRRSTAWKQILVAIYRVCRKHSTYSAQEVVARELAVKLASAIKTEVAANTVSVRRGALATRLGGKQHSTALLARKADVCSRARVTCASTHMQ